MKSLLYRNISIINNKQQVHCSTQWRDCWLISMGLQIQLQSRTKVADTPCKQTFSLQMQFFLPTAVHSSCGKRGGLMVSALVSGSSGPLDPETIVFFEQKGIF